MGNGAVQGSRDEEIVAFCDVDWRDTGSKRSAYQMAQEHPEVPRFNDFRDMLDKKGKDIDAVLISTPDHTHFADVWWIIIHTERQNVCGYCQR
jgi:predicted dehydrogenase